MQQKNNIETSQKSALSLRQSPFSKSTLTTLALGIPGVITPSFVLAEDAVVLDKLQIEERTVDTNPYAEEGAPYKAKVSGDMRRVKPLAETPATISVLTQTAIQESGDTDLRAILANQPGITLGTGENGNAFGDRYVIRGHEARSDVFVDGLRDPGMTIRESFAVEQIEITKGPSSTFAGRGSTGGAVNSITKQAETEYNFNKIQAGIGTDQFRRITLDSNLSLSENAAVRANLLHNYQEVPDRGPADRKRNGIALSGAMQATEKLKFVADYYRLDAEDKPDLGSYIDRTTGEANAEVPVYLQDEDFLDSTVDTFTFRLNYVLSDNLVLNNATRYGTTDNGYVATGINGNSLSTHNGWQEVEYFANMTNLVFDTTLAGLTHNFVISSDLSRHKVLNGVYDYTATQETNCIVNGRGGARPGFCITDENGNYLPNIGNIIGRDINKGAWDSDYKIDTWSIAVMDTIDLNDMWSLFLGVRADHFEYENDVIGQGAITPTRYDYSDTLWNGHLGITYNITDEALIYATVSTSSNINGGESDVGGSCGYGGLCGDPIQVGDSEPEQTQNLEIGTKWNIFNEKLLLTAAIFQINKDDVMESVGDSYSQLGTLNTGENKVEGIEISASGNLSQKISVQAGAAIMNAEVEDSFDRESNVGKTLANFADKSAFLQLRHQTTDSFSFGATATYSSEVFVGQPDSAANEDLGVPSYTVYDLFASYQLSQKTNLRLNVGNVSDKDYYLTAYRSGSFAYIGDRRNSQLTLSHEF